MPFTESDYLANIAEELSQSSNTRLLDLLPIYWDLHADKGGVLAQYLYTKRSAIDALLGGIWEAVDVNTGAVTGSVLLSQQTKNLQALRANVQAEILRLSGNVSTSTPTTTLSEPFIGSVRTEFG